VKKLVIAFTLAGVFGAAGCKRNEPRENVGGSGSSFVWPIMTRWVHEYERKEGKKVDYRPRGSSAGIKDLFARKVDFACSDGPLSDKQMAELKESGNEVVHVPLILSAVVAVYNLDEIKEPIRFTGPVLAEIYLGKIKKWNDVALRKLNPALALPDKDIHVVHRSDGSGTTYIWTDYLSKVSPDWNKKVGTDREVTWPVGVGADQNEGVTDKVKQTPGSIGYVDLADAYRKSLAFGLVENRSKEFVRASLDSVVRAADNRVKDLPSDLRFSLTDAPGKDTYPITGTTWAIVYLDQTKNKRGKDLVGFLKWVVEDGQLFADQLLYSRMPEELANHSVRAIERIQVEN
jgi:phosphate ABC transporter phosphate-binding protein